MSPNSTEVNAGGMDWTWKLREAIDRIKNHYDYIGRNTGAPFLAIVYPPEAEKAVLKEWNALVATFGSGFDVCNVNVLEVISQQVEEIGVENVVDAICHPMPGSDAEVDLANIWHSALVQNLKDVLSNPTNQKRVIILDHLAALFPASGPRGLMQTLWDTSGIQLSCPIVIFIPGRLVEARVYEFLNKSRELMYRGDIL